jgi:hypothetical protein
MILLQFVHFPDENQSTFAAWAELNEFIQRSHVPRGN